MWHSLSNFGGFFRRDDRVGANVDVVIELLANRCLEALLVLVAEFLKANFLSLSGFHQIFYFVQVDLELLVSTDSSVLGSAVCSSCKPS